MKDKHNQLHKKVTDTSLFLELFGNYPLTSNAQMKFSNIYYCREKCTHAAKTAPFLSKLE